VTTQLSDVDIAQWRDKKRHLWLMLIAPTALFVVLPLVWAFNQWGWHVAAQVPFWVGPILLYIVLPALDLRYGPDGQNPPDEVMERLENDRYYRYCTYIYIPFQYASVIFGAYLFIASDLSWLGFDGALAWPAKIGLALSVGMLGGVGINTAHELGHKKDALERWLAKITLAQTWYGHFFIEHNRGNHVRVPRPRIRRRPGSGRRSGSSCRAASPAACGRRGSLRRSGCVDSARVRSTSAMTCSMPG
jgi:alkane 1-monooxygenase